MPQNNSQTPRLNTIKGWILDVYPADEGEVTVWVLSEIGERIRLTDSFQPKIYVSGNQDEIERLASRFYKNQDIATWSFAEKYAQPTDQQKTRVLEITLKDYRKTPHFTREILRLGDYTKYQIQRACLVQNPFYADFA